jgi:hypothetical protein
MRLGYLVAVLLASSLACGPTMAKREAVLSEYRRALARVPVERNVKKPSGNPALLVGLPGDKIRQSLGDPHECGEHGPPPCEAPGDWFYSFYPVDDGADGGGLELLLRFDRNGNCSEARWSRTE